MMIRWLLVCIFLMGAYTGCAQTPKAKASHVVLISFDGLRPDVLGLMGEDKAPTFHELIKEGASTLNARTDYNYTVTLPNHTCMITGQPALGAGGHQVLINTIVSDTVHDYANHQVDSVFTVLRQNHRQSAMLASKLKFDIYQHSFPIDIVSLTNHDDLKTVKFFEALIQKNQLPDFVFMHFANPDYVGHHQGWDITKGSAYRVAVEQVDRYLRRVIDAINSKDHLKDSTIVIVTSDHGGQGMGHSNNTNPRNFTIPFIIWGKAVAKGVDLYKINQDRRQDPLDQRIDYKAQGQPIRNGDAANLALSLLGFPLIKGSTIGYSKPLKIDEE